MKEKKQNEELQSRREFFKEAAKKALPVLGAIALASSPIIAQAAEKNTMGCNGLCTGGCYTSCQRGCKGGCEVVCNSACVTTCKGGCLGCSGTCKTSVNH